MDTLLLTENVIIVIEVKNWQGTTIFGENGQVTRRTLDARVEGFQNPISQVKTQVYRLQKWLQNHHFPHIPIEYFVVISSPSTIIESSSSTADIPNEVIHNNELLFRIQELEEKYNTKFISRDQLNRAAYLLKDKHVPPLRNMLKYYNISADDLIKGVFCPECGTSPMERKKHQWFCSKCGYYSREAHDAALNDYLLIVSDKITNREARIFLMVSLAMS